MISAADALRRASQVLETRKVKHSDMVTMAAKEFAGKAVGDIDDNILRAANLGLMSVRQPIGPILEDFRALGLEIIMGELRNVGYRIAKLIDDDGSILLDISWARI